MRGKSVQLAEHWILQDAASMRPAHYAREVDAMASYMAKYLTASMRPAHYAREVSLRFVPIWRILLASMRPAHYAREVNSSQRARGCDTGSFNEARALCAGSQSHYWQG